MAGWQQNKGGVLKLGWEVCPPPAWHLSCLPRTRTSSGERCIPLRRADDEMLLPVTALALRASFDVRYINLASRTDRLAQIKSEFARQGYLNPKIGVQAERIAGHVADRRFAAAGALACTQSHVDAVRSITADVGLIAEDDCQFLRALPAGERGGHGERLPRLGARNAQVVGRVL